MTHFTNYQNYKEKNQIIIKTKAAVTTLTIKPRACTTTSYADSIEQQKCTCIPLLLLIHTLLSLSEVNPQAAGTNSGTVSL